MKKIFNNALICEKGNKTKEVHIIVEKGIITELYEGEAPVFIIDKSIEIIDLGGLLVLPAGIDTHVHFNDPGYTERETYETGTKAAIRGGITTVIDMPFTSIPPITNVEGYVKRVKSMKGHLYADVGLRAGISANSFENSENIQKDMEALVNKGIFAFKVYLISSMPTFKQLSPEQLEKVLEIARSLNVQVDCHAEDPTIINELNEKLKNDKDILAYAKSRPIEAEVKGIETFLKALKKTGAKGHIVHVSSKEGALLIKNYKEMGVDVTFETCPHYLAFNQNDFHKLGSSLKTAPVVKMKEDSEALWNMLADSTVDFIATDHAPSPEKMKNTGSIWTDYSGIPGLETFIDYVYNEGVLKNRISLEKFIEITSYNAAKRYGIERLGKLEEGYYANFIAIDSDEPRTVKGKDFYSKGKITPFEDMKFQSSVVKTFIRGDEVWSAYDKSIAKIPKGRHIKMKTD